MDIRLDIITDKEINTQISIDVLEITLDDGTSIMADWKGTYQNLTTQDGDKFLTQIELTHSRFYSSLGGKVNDKTIRRMLNKAKEVYIEIYAEGLLDLDGAKINLFAELPKKDFEVYARKTVVVGDKTFSL